mgnify:CR=1 FL=1
MEKMPHTLRRTKGKYRDKADHLTDRRFRDLTRTVGRV